MRTRIFWVALVALFLSSVVAQAAEVFEKPYAPKLALVCLNASENPKAAAKLLKAMRIFFTNHGYVVTESETVNQAIQKLGIAFTNPMPVKPIWNLGREVRAQNIIAFRGDINNRRVWVNLIPKSKSTVVFDSLILGTDELDLICEQEKRSGEGNAQSGSLLQDYFGLTFAFPISGAITLATDGGYSKLESKALDHALMQAFGRFLERQITMQKMFGPREEKYF